MPPRHIALAVLVAVIWGANYVVIDLGLGDLPPTLFVALRFVVVLVPAIAFVPRPLVPWRDVMTVGLFMSLGQFALLYTALAVGMPAGLASLVLQAQVGLTVVIAALVVPLPLLALSLAIDGPDAVSHALTHLTGAAVLSTLYTA